MDRTINTSGRHCFETGQMIVNNSFRIDKFLGNGAFGEVYLATQLPLNVQRAIKVIRKAEPGLGSTEFEHYRDRFTLEARLGATFFHPNIIHVENFIEEQDRLLLVMNYAPGGSLAEKIAEAQQKGEPIPIDQAVKWVREAAQGLAKLHERDLVHRDIKPSNILINADGEACIADLGLVQTDTSHIDGSSLDISLGRNHPGTAEYMPPEQLPGNSLPLRASADVYALGCVLFELLTLKKYYHRPVGTQAGSLRQDIPLWLDQVLEKALHPDAKKRYQSAGEMEASLAFGGSKPIDEIYKVSPAPPLSSPSTGTDSSGTTSQLPSRRTALPYLFGGFAFILVIILIVVLSSHPNGSDNQPGQTTSSNADSLPVSDSSGTANTITSPVDATKDSSQEPDTGSTLTSAVDGMVMDYVPSGTFLMGSPAGVGDNDEHPQHSIDLDAFWIDKTEITNARYKKCVDAGVCSPPYSSSSATRSSYFGNPEFDEYPVIYVSWDQADNYCRWVGRQLPTEAQWEKAARGTSGQTYPWGNAEMDNSRANFADVNTDFKYSNHTINDGYADTSPVGNYPKGASPYGALDMAGNVWEWVSDYYSADYYSYSPSNNPTGPDSGFHFLRGGSWGTIADVLRTANRNIGDETPADEFSGFRCVLNIKD